eukprot:TRINITY_DN18865_c0_g1_i1.p2 TRINITY_DN18865_c0_g1~~TRINITY_DN18865_c0_g1_i1.p2  ORF type:complete len:136 (+),score=19.16 TRINITY_DN18865_c0_g1_i1:88-495(+)
MCIRDRCQQLFCSAHASTERHECTGAVRVGQQSDLETLLALSDTDFTACVGTLHRVLANVSRTHDGPCAGEPCRLQPCNMQFRRLHLSNSAIKQKIAAHPQAVQLLAWVGFQREGNKLMLPADLSGVVKVPVRCA